MTCFFNSYFVEPLEMLIWRSIWLDLRWQVVVFSILQKREMKGTSSPHRGCFIGKLQTFSKFWPSKTPMNGCLSSGISIEFFYVNSWEIFHWFHFDRKSIIYFIKNIWNFQIPVESRNYICAEKAPAWQGFKTFLRSSNPVGNQLSKLMKTREQGVKYVQS